MGDKALSIQAIASPQPISQQNEQQRKGQQEAQPPSKIEDGEKKKDKKSKPKSDKGLFDDYV